MARPRLWLVNQYAGSPRHGMNFRSYYLGRELVEKGYDVEMISGAYSHLLTRPPATEGTYTRETIDGIHYTWVDLPHYRHSKSAMRFWSMLVFFWRLWFLDTKPLGRPDVILVSSISPFPILWASVQSKKYGARLVFEVRDIWPLTLMRLGGFSRHHPLIMLLQWIENFAYRRSDYVVSVLPKALEHMRLHGLDAARFCYIPNGIRPEEMEAAEALDEATLDKIPDGKFIVGYVGTLGIANALEYLIDAAKLLAHAPDVQILIVGGGGAKHDLERQAAGAPNVTFVDAIPKRQVPSMLARCDALYIGWHDEPELYRFGVSANKLFEYMYAAKPIVHAIHAGNDPVQESGAGLSIPPESPEAVAEAIMRLRAMPPAERDRMGENGRAYVLEHHTYAKLAEGYEAFFEDAHE